MPVSILTFQDVTMHFAKDGAPGRLVLDGVSCELAPRSIVSLVGRSGSGKSTLLHLAAGISVPVSGSVRLADQELSHLGEADRTTLRRNHVGLVFQFFHLLSHLSVLENVSLPGWVAGCDNNTLASRAADLLERVGLQDRADDPVGKLSGGEMQRVAICRALVLSPSLILADEPTGSLDESTGRQVMDLLVEMVRKEGCGLLYATHSSDLAGAADVTWHLRDGRLEKEDRR